MRGQPGRAAVRWGVVSAWNYGAISPLNVCSLAFKRRGRRHLASSAPYCM